MTDRCHWCKQFVSKRTGMTMLRDPDTLYCKACFSKGVEMENEAMGLYDERYYSRLPAA